MKIEIREVTDAKSFKTFIHLPVKLHQNDPKWIPPIYMDDRIYFNPKKNKSFQTADTILLLAYKNRSVVGRVMGIVSHKSNEKTNSKDARFCWLEGFDDHEVIKTLLDFLSAWALKKGMERLVGPFGFSDKDPQGYLIEGYEFDPVIITNYNDPNVNKTIESYGFTKEVDLFAYRVDIPKETPEIYQKIKERFKKKANFRLLEFSKRRELKKYIRPIFHLVNETFIHIYGFVPFEEHEMDDFASRYLPVIDPRFVKVVLKDKEPVAFVIGMPDISEGIRKSKGYVLPFGIFKIWKSQKKTNRLVLLLGAVKEEYRGLGLDVIMGIAMFRDARKQGFDHLDSHLELEENVKMRAEMQKLGGVPYKKYRVYQKKL